MELTRESAGTDEPGDENAESRLGPHAFWSLGPRSDGTWGLGLIQRGPDLEEIESECVRLGVFPDAAAAKAAAFRNEMDGAA